MSKIICSTCGTVLKAEYKFCVFCGNDPKGKTKPTTEITTRKQETFFCPMCKHENPVNEIICSNCGENFGEDYWKI